MKIRSGKSRTEAAVLTVFNGVMLYFAVKWGCDWAGGTITAFIGWLFGMNMCRWMAD